MLNNIPEEIKSFCETTIGSLESFQPATGGCINSGGKITTSNGVFFLKWNSAKKHPQMFAVEASGLKLLSQQNCIQVPKPVAVHEGAVFSGIVMEHIYAAPRASGYWTSLAHSLACLHRITVGTYGLDHNNYIGSLPQYNNPTANWVDFFIRNRLQPQLKIATDNGKLNKEDMNKFDRFQRALPDLLIEEKPALIHGDLWSGNLMIGANGNPVIIDPAVAYSNREMEIAFTRLFGGFDLEFYNVYQEIFAMEAGYEDRFEIYNTYPLLVHVNLFGGGYYQQVMQIVEKFI